MKPTGSFARCERRYYFFPPFFLFFYDDKRLRNLSHDAVCAWTTIGFTNTVTADRSYRSRNGVGRAAAVFELNDAKQQRFINAASVTIRCEPCERYYAYHFIIIIIIIIGRKRFSFQSKRRAGLESIGMISRGFAGVYCDLGRTYLLSLRLDKIVVDRSGRLPLIRHCTVVRRFQNGKISTRTFSTTRSYHVQTRIGDFFSDFVF